MSKKVLKTPDYRRVELDGVEYVILRESIFEELCRRAEVGLEATVEPGAEADALDGATLAEKLVRRRRASGLSQAELARRAGIRPETLNRIERGRTTPDFATVRKLVLAMNAAEEAAAQTSLADASRENESTKRTQKQE
ncbi:MAG: helix-turn-helix transcriptional regulator [Planctomycetaceae bacterium]|nr:helix-turn-helix transcriptional regulator [Planctomycetaceae bacterium]